MEHVLLIFSLILISIALTVKKISRAVESMPYKPPTCSKHCCAETVLRTKEEQRRWRNEVLRRADLL